MKIMSYFSVEVVKSGTVVKKKLLEIDLENTVSVLFSEVDENFKINRIVSKTSPQDEGHELKNDTPLHVVSDFGGKYIVIFVTQLEKQQEQQKGNAFSVLMSNRLTKCYPDKIDSTKMRNDYTLFNDLIDLFVEKQFSFSPESVLTAGKLVLRTLSGALWWMSPHHKKLEARNVKIPEMFSKFADYYDHRLAHKATPKVILINILHACHIGILSTCMCLWGGGGTSYHIYIHVFNFNVCGEWKHIHIPVWGGGARHIPVRGSTTYIYICVRGGTSYSPV